MFTLENYGKEYKAHNYHLQVNIGDNETSICHLLKRNIPQCYGYLIQVNNTWYVFDVRVWEDFNLTAYEKLSYCSRAPRLHFVKDFINSKKIKKIETFYE